MTQELIYTSAPAGLKPGSRGFCTVVSTRGMAVNLADRLEALSGYRQVFPSHHPQAAANPIVWSHLRLIIGGKRLHILSRIAAAGLDYTQRTNKFAHHVVLDASELNAGGPAALLQSAGFMQTTWDGQPKVLPAGRQPPSVVAPPQPCAAWQRLTGDAGWAGIVAATAAGNGKTPVILLFQPGQDVLPLFAECLALLPTEQRWNMTFSTYYTKLPGVDCQWRAILAGTPEALAAKRTPGAVVIDLTNRLPAPAAGEYVDAARAGRMISLPVAPLQPQPHLAPLSAALPSDDELARLLQADAAVTAAQQGLSAAPSQGDAVVALDSAALGVGPPPLAARPFAINTLPRTFKKKPKRWPIFVAVTAMVLIGAGVGIMIMFGTSGQKTSAVAPTTPPVPNDEQKRELPESSPSIADEKTPKPSDEEKRDLPGKASPDDEPKPIADAEAASAQKTDAKTADPGLLSPPATSETAATNENATGEPVAPESLAKAPTQVAVGKAEQTSPKGNAPLGVKSRDNPFKSLLPSRQIELPENRNENLGKYFEWIQFDSPVNGLIVELLNGDCFGHSGKCVLRPENVDSWMCVLKDKPIAAFRMRDKEWLEFAWLDSSSDVRKLRNCLLQLTTVDGTDRVVIALRNVQHPDHARFSKTKTDEIKIDDLPTESKDLKFSLAVIECTGEVKWKSPIPQPMNQIILKTDTAIPVCYMVTLIAKNGDLKLERKYLGLELDVVEWKKLNPKKVGDYHTLAQDAPSKHVEQLKETLGGTKNTGSRNANHRGNQPIPGKEKELADVMQAKPVDNARKEALENEIREIKRQIDVANALPGLLDNVQNRCLIRYSVMYGPASAQIVLAESVEPKPDERNRKTK